MAASSIEPASVERENAVASVMKVLANAYTSRMVTSAYVVPVPSLFV